MPMIPDMVTSPLSKKEVLEGLAGLDLSKYPVQEIHALIRQLGKYAVIATTFHRGQIILRARINGDGEIFNKINDLWYKPAEHNKTYQRASTPYKTMFYGALIHAVENEKKKMNSAQFVGLCEVSKLFRDKSITSGQQRITYGKWVATKDITVASIIHHNDYTEKNAIIKQMQDEYNGYVKALGEEMMNESSLISEFFANQFAKVETPNDYDYMLSAVYAERIAGYKYGDIQLAGVLYPSVRAEAQGFNVALTKECVEDALHLEFVAECTIYKEGSSIMVDNEKQAALTFGQKEFNLQAITDPKVHAGKDRIYEELRKMNAG